MYGSDLVTQRTVDSISKGYQATFIEFTEASKKGGINKNAGLINVSSKKPAVNHVWYLVNSVIEDINEDMIPVLEHFGVQQGVDLSVFCREYEDVTSFKETFVDYMGGKDQQKTSKAVNQMRCKFQKNLV